MADRFEIVREVAEAFAGLEPATRAVVAAGACLQIVSGPAGSLATRHGQPGVGWAIFLSLLVVGTVLLTAGGVLIAREKGHPAAKGAFLGLLSLVGLAILLRMADR